jgi:hypothetical protein
VGKNENDWSTRAFFKISEKVDKNEDTIWESKKKNQLKVKNNLI